MVEIKSNYQPRDLLSGYELDVNIWVKEFDYYTYEELMDCTEQFFKYKGEWYDAHEFERVPTFEGNEWKGWDGIMNQAFYFGILIRYAEDGVIVGRYCT